MLAFLVLIIVIAISGVFFLSSALENKQYSGINEYEAVAFAIATHHQAAASWASNLAPTDQRQSYYITQDDIKPYLDSKYNYTSDIASFYVVKPPENKVFIATYLTTQAANRFDISDIALAMHNMKDVGLTGGLSDSEGCVTAFKETRKFCVGSGRIPENTPTFITQIR